MEDCWPFGVGPAGAGVKPPWSCVLARHSAEELAAVAAALNGRPRKTLAWRTPAEVLTEYLSAAA
jgi:IS30 family transposase